LYFFSLNHNRTGPDFGSDEQLQQQQDLQNLDDDVSPALDMRNTSEPDAGLSSSITVGKGFAAITDIETGPDGNLYFSSYLDGKIYRISSASAITTISQPSNNATDKVHTPILN
jgi:hypothetical protein